MFHRTLLCLLPACLALLAACSEPFDFWEGRGATKPNHPYTWQEWVARETPTGPDFVPYARRKLGPPNVEAWRPEDFLPEGYLKAEHADVCSLPLEEREKVWPMTSFPGRIESLAERLEYAKRGFIDAQAGLGWYCLASNRAVNADPALGFTRDDALDWARRGAASGDPNAMYMLANCMQMYEFEIPFKDRDPLWSDQAYYWLSRAASEFLHEEALRMLSAGGWPRYEYPSRDAYNIDDYKWSRLGELQSIFRRIPHFLGQHTVDKWNSALDLRAELSPAQLKAGEAAVSDWLKTHHDVWDKIASRPLRPAWAGPHCPGERGHRAAFDYDGLNRELAKYGLAASSPSN